MSDGEKPDEKQSDKKDLTGIFSVPPASTNDTSFNPSTQDQSYTQPPTETVDSFESMVPDMSLPDQFAPPEPVPETVVEALPDLDPFPTAAPPTATEIIPQRDEMLDDLRQYSHSVQGSSQLVQVFVPYHLYLTGTFGPYERDKLLLFITENDIGVSSQDLDLQIRSGKVFFPRISEFAGIKLIQELRDSGLQFRFVSSDRDGDEGTHHSDGVAFHYQPESAEAKPLSPMPVLNENSKTLTEYVELDTIQINQYLKAEIVEAERSDLFQEVLERMLESLKHKARIKGGDALSGVHQKITPLRLPSQYQIMVQATVLKKKP